MKKILIATHGTFASGARSTIQFLVGEAGDITCIDAYVNPEENLLETLKQYFSAVKSTDQVIVLTDIKGGSVTQKIMSYGMSSNVHMIAGFNLPLLLSLALAPEELSEQEIEQLIEESKQQMELVKVKLEETQDDFFE